MLMPMQMINSRQILSVFFFLAIRLLKGGEVMRPPAGRSRGAPEFIQ